MSAPDPHLERVAGKVARGERLFTEDGLAILRTPDLVGLGRLADARKRQVSGDAVFFAANKHLNYSNVCRLDCGFCRFSRRRGEAGAYELSADELLAEIPAEVREVHLVGSLHPDWPFDRYPEMLRAIRRARPGIGIKGFTAVEICHFAEISGLGVSRVLTRLKEAGLDSLPGGGAEVFSPRVRRLLCPDKPSGKAWLDVHREAHRLGLPSNATILYGHVETLEERVSHLTAIRELQEQTGGFRCFVPLPFQEWEAARYRPPDPCDDLRMIALSRLYLDNIPHVKAYWVMLGLETAALGLCYGADDLDGTVLGERIAHAAGAPTPPAIDAALIAHLAAQAGKTAVERDASYHRIAHA